jgi:hypothetical protein
LWRRCVSSSATVAVGNQPGERPKARCESDQPDSKSDTYAGTAAHFTARRSYENPPLWNKFLSLAQRRRDRRNGLVERTTVAAAA